VRRLSTMRGVRALGINKYLRKGDPDARCGRHGNHSRCLNKFAEGALDVHASILFSLSPRHSPPTLSKVPLVEIGRAVDARGYSSRREPHSNMARLDARHLGQQKSFINRLGTQYQKCIRYLLHIRVNVWIHVRQHMNRHIR